MSLFASLGQGDIWALSGISFASPINDLLDSGNYSLEELLSEDELIQEVKAKNDRLIEFLCTEESIEALVDYVITPSSSTDLDDRKFKYPYMSCEVICCEVPELLYMLTHGWDGKFIKKLFTFLDQEGELDCYLAGYFEKILEMLFRKATSHMMAFFNSSGSALLKSFLSHVQNYSIMQIIQRLMLPHLPFSVPNDNDLNFEEAKDHDQCHWSYMPETCELLLYTMLGPTHPDVPLHISDMLITVLQLSPPETLLISFLCRSDSIQSLLKYSTEEISADLGEEELTMKSNIALAATSVLESLISRLYESGFPMQPNESDIGLDQSKIIALVNEQISQICDELIPFVPRITAVLTRILASREKTMTKFQSKVMSPKLGHHGLQIIKLIESLTRIGNPNLDQSFCANKLFEVCIDLFLSFEYNSVLHLSVQRIFVSIFEGTSSRRETQAYICSNSNLLGIIMEKIGESDSQRSNQLGYFRSDETHTTYSSRHSSLIGNLVLIAHAAFLLLDTSEREDVDEHGGDHSKVFHHHDHDDQSPSKPTIEIPSDSHDYDRTMSTLEARADKESRDRAVLLRDTIADADLLQLWDGFTFTKLKAILDHQMMGSYEVPNPEIPYLHDDGFKNPVVDTEDGGSFGRHFDDEDDDDVHAIDDDHYDEFGDNAGYGSIVSTMGSTMKMGEGSAWTANFDESDPGENGAGGFADFADFASFDSPLASLESEEVIDAIATSIPSDHLSRDEVDIDFDTANTDF